MKTIHKGFVSPLLLALIALLLIGGGAYVYVQNKPVNQNVAVQTSDLKTYTNTQYGFSLKYPTNFTLEEVPNGTNSVFAVKIYDANYKAPEGAVGQDIQRGQKLVTLNIYGKSDEVLNSIRKVITLEEPKDKGDLWSEKSITVDGRAATFYELWSGLVGTNYESYVSNDKYIYTAESFQGDLLEEILSTFKFNP